MKQHAKESQKGEKEEDHHDDKDVSDKSDEEDVVMSRLTGMSQIAEKRNDSSIVGRGSYGNDEPELDEDNSETPCDNAVATMKKNLNEEDARGNRDLIETKNWQQYLIITGSTKIGSYS